MVSTRYDQVVLEIEWFVLAMDKLSKKNGQGGPNLLDGPFYFVCKHPVHRRDDLYWHVDKPLREYEADVVVGGRCKSFLKYGAQRGVRVCLGKKIFGERFDRRVLLWKQNQRGLLDIGRMNGPCGH